ncbi:hypothetical protein NPIL_6331 [Nephila pilipes]|uniref:Uncharacterized protein n=1 Tax=Nephila pilipes TaxID=299642 RepID=A0A8X6MBQ7_NEPPI|nr:hypothetical protein NPIL_6331 [Nephila pilipes]
MCRFSRIKVASQRMLFGTLDNIKMAVTDQLKTISASEIDHRTKILLLILGSTCKRAYTLLLSIAKAVLAAAAIGNYRRFALYAAAPHLAGTFWYMQPPLQTMLPPAASTLSPRHCFAVRSKRIAENCRS